MRSIPILLLLFLALALPAFASDGVLEINQTCAVNTGCFAGDAAGLPVTITASGSYRLTSNLVVPNENTSGIQLTSDNVSIDLAGFEIRGPVVCSGTPLVCTPSSGLGSGVQGSRNQSGTSVRNGSIRGMGLSGLFLGVQAEVKNVRVRSNGRCGIDTSESSIISGNTAYQNGIAGICAKAGSTVSGNAAYQNGSDGIDGSSGSTILGNTANENGGDGISASSGSTVLGNTVRLNTGFGLNLVSPSGYRENVISNNTAGTVFGGVNAGNNVCNGLLTCP